MGKKKKKEPISLNGSPLQAITIGEIKKSKYGWIGTLVLLVFFAALIYFLPAINEWYLEFKGSSVAPMPNPMVGNTTNTTEDPGEEPEAPEATKYALDANPELEFGNLTFDEFSVFGVAFEYTVTNGSTANIDLEDKQLYFEFYDDNGIMLKRSYVTGELLAAGTSDKLIGIPEEATQFSLLEITEDNYTYIDMELDENKMSTLTCSKTNEELIYTFKDGELVKINHDLQYYKTESDYDDTYAYYSNLIDDYANIEGITSTLESNSEYLTYTIEIDYTKYSKKIDGITYFARKSEPREVNFKMEAMDYSCR